MRRKSFNKLTALFIILTLLWSDFAFMMQGLLSIAEGEQEEEPFTISIEQKAIKQTHMINTENTDYTQDNEIMLQTKFKISIDAEESEKQVTNINRTDITIFAPKYNGKNATRVEVNSKKTEMTKGRIFETEFSQSDYAYDSVNNILTIQVENNQAKEGAFGEDEYYISYFYNNLEYDSNISIDEKINASISLVKEDVNRVISAEKEKTLNFDNVTNNLADIEIVTNTDKIGKGKIYANMNSQNAQYITEYDINTILNINYFERINRIQIEDSMSIFSNMDGNAQYIIEEGAINYISTKINKNQLNMLLGEDGYLHIYDKSGNIIATIDNNSIEDENGFYIINWETPISSIIIETSKPIKNGFLEIFSRKQINNNLGCSKEQIISSNTFSTVENIKSELEEERIEQQTNQLNIHLTETTTSAKISVNNKNLSTDIENENVQWKIELNNSNYNSDLWNSPILIIEFPEEIENIEIENISLLYQDVLELLRSEIVEQNGRITIRIHLQGNQEQYISDSIQNGTTILLNTKIKLKELTSGKTDNIVNLYYYNDNVSKYDNPVEYTYERETYIFGNAEATIDYISPIGMKSIQRISNYDENGSYVYSANQGEKTGKLKILQGKKISKMELILLNNTGNDVTQIKAIGRVPFKGNKSIQNEDLGTTIDTVMKSPIIGRNIGNKRVIIYYSENENATDDINLSSNGWTTNISNIENVKSFLILIDGMNVGETISFEYNFEIPAKLEHGEYLYGAFTTYFTHITQEGYIPDVSIADKVGLTTGIGARLAISQDVSVGNGTLINEEDHIKYKIRVENTGSIPAEEVKVVNKIPEWTIYIEESEKENPVESVIEYEYYQDANELTWDIGTLNEGQVVELEFEVKVLQMPGILEYYGQQDGFTKENDTYYLITINEETGERTKQEITSVPQIFIKNQASVRAKNLEQEIMSNITLNEVQRTDISIVEESSIDKSVIINEEQEYEYRIFIGNKTDSKIENIEILKEIPEGVTYKEANSINRHGDINYNEGTRRLTVIIDKLEVNETAEIIVKVEANKLTDGEYEKEIRTKTYGSANNGKETISNEIINYIGKPKIEYNYDCDIKDSYIYEGDILTYTISATNTARTVLSNANITLDLPEELAYASGNYEKDGIVYTIAEDESQTIKVIDNLKQNETINITIKAKVNKIRNTENDKYIEVNAYIEGNNLTKTQIGSIKHKLQVNGSSSNPNGDDTNNGGNGKVDIDENGNVSYRIRGTAWVDINKDGERQNNEILLSGVKVYLMNAEGSSIVRDAKTGEEKIAVTDINGEYCFKNLQAGNYLVIFIYNDEEYDITEYQKKNVIAERNSDVIITQVNFNGEITNGAVTDLIKVTDRNIINIDIGLVTKSIFDLKIDNTINKITVKTANSNKDYEYSNTNFAKVEIHSKEIKNALVIIEYNIKITNNGDVEGTASKIVDEIPNGLNFSSELNELWYIGNDGKLYSTQLENLIIKPGESKDIKLILTKQMTESNNGTFTNKVSILDTYNNKKIRDKNTTNNNSQSTCLISISTGQAVIYTSVILIVLIIVATGIIVFKRMEIKPKKIWR